MFVVAVSASNTMIASPRSSCRWTSAIFSSIVRHARRLCSLRSVEVRDQ